MSQNSESRHGDRGEPPPSLCECARRGRCGRRSNRVPSENVFAVSKVPPCGRPARLRHRDHSTDLPFVVLHRRRPRKPDQRRRNVWLRRKGSPSKSFAAMFVTLLEACFRSTAQGKGNFFGKHAYSRQSPKLGLAAFTSPVSACSPTYCRAAACDAMGQKRIQAVQQRIALVARLVRRCREPRRAGQAYMKLASS